MLFDFLFVWPKSNLADVSLCGYFKQSGFALGMCNLLPVSVKNPLPDGYGVLKPALEASAAPQIGGDCTLAAGDALQTFEFCTTLDLGVAMTLFWNGRNAARNTVELALQTSVRSGWAGVGPAAAAGTMAGATVLVAAYEAADLRVYSLTGPPAARGVTAAPAALDVISSGTVRSGGKLTLFATLGGVTKDAYDLVYAAGAWDADSDEPGYHSYRGAAGTGRMGEDGADGGCC